MLDKQYSDIIPHDQPPTFNQLVEIIEKNFRASMLQTGDYTPAEVEESWQRYKALNHLHPSESAGVLPNDVVEKILKVRDALVIGDKDEAYHQLYGIPCPDYSLYFPWEEYEKQVNYPKLNEEQIKSRFEFDKAHYTGASAVWVKAQLEGLRGYIAGLADRTDDHFEKGVHNQRIGDLHIAITVIERYKDFFDESPSLSPDQRKEGAAQPNKEDAEEKARGKAWDDWKDSLLKYDNRFVHPKSKEVKYTEPFTLEEFSNVLLNKAPVFIFCDQWSRETPIYQITKQPMPSGLEYFCNAWADKTPKHITIERFYKELRMQGLAEFHF